MDELKTGQKAKKMIQLDADLHERLFLLKKTRTDKASVSTIIRECLDAKHPEVIVHA
jgi:hypothetical protein